MKLLFVTHWANNMLIFRRQLLCEALRSGHEVIVLCPWDQSALEFSQLGIRHISWKFSRTGGIVSFFQAILHARCVLKAEQPDRTVVYCVQPILAVLLAKRFGGSSGKLFPTFTGMGTLWTDVRPASWKKKLVRWIVERLFGRLLVPAQKIFVLNRDDLGQVLSWNEKCLQGKVQQTLGEGVDLQRFTPADAGSRSGAKARWSIPAGTKVIGFVGRLIHEKGASDFLKICKELQSNEGIHFLVVGSPDPGNPTSLSTREVEELSKQKNVTMQSWMDDLRPAFAAMDALLFLSAREGLPITPLEAMASGVPVFAYDATGTREIFEKEQLVPQGDWQSIVKKVNGACPALEQLQEQVKKYDREKICKDFLSRVLEDSQP